MLEFAWSNLPNNLIQIGLTVSAAALVLFVLRRVLKKRYPARAICFVWALLAIRLLVPVQFTLPDPPVQITPPERTLYVTYRWNADAADAVPSGTPQAEQVQAERPRGEWMTESEFENRAVNVNGPWMNAIHVDNVLVMVWLIGILYNALRQWRDYRRYLRQLNRPSADAQRDTLRRVFAEQKQSLGIRRDIPLVVTPAADCPMLAGFLKPTLYLPDEALSEQEAMFIFRHELTHYKRGDLWLKLLLTAAKTVHWFNPLVYLMARFAQEDIELACDDAVVRGMDSAQRRAYGETILRSAVAQVKKRALVSCFTGDKETLMRRFEGLFDKRAKKRGVALIVAAAVLVGTLGCTISVGESKNELTEELRLQLAQEWLQRPEYETTNATVKLDGDDTYILYDHYNKVVWEGEIVQSLPLRTGAKLSFEKDGDGWQVSGSELIAESGVASLDEFRILYENDLGFPDFLGRIAQSDWDPSMMDISTPDKAAVNLLYLRGNISVREGIQEDICDVSVTFADGSEVTITMVNQFGDGWLPQDFTYDGGRNERTAADLAGQYARGVTHKSGQYIYPILTAQKQEEFRTAQQIPGGGFSWKYGGSSPSYRGYTLVPTSGGEYIAVFQMYGGGVEDMRSAFLITTAQADGRRVIDRVTEVAASNYTKSDLFKLYYDSGLPWPTIPEGADNFNGASLDTLTRVRDAVETVFGYFGENVEHIEGDQHLYTLESWFKSEVISEGETDAVVRLTFVDNSPSVDVRMRKTDGYWLPVGIASQFDDGFGATAESGGETVALPAGQDIAGAVNAAEAAGGIPQLQNGDAIALRFGAQPAGDVTLTERDINIDSGTPRYDTRLDVETTLPHSADGVYTYTVEPSMGQYLSSQYPDVFYRAVTADYTDESGTARTATFVFCMTNGDAQPDYTITSTTYHNDTYGYTLTLPECFVGQGYATESADSIVFGLANALPGYSDNPTDGGTVMCLSVGSTVVLEENNGANWEENFPMPCKKLAELDGLTWYLTFASDVQYDPQDEAIAAAYTEMYQAAQAITPDALSFEGQTDRQWERLQEKRLSDLGWHYGTQVLFESGSSGSVSVTPDAGDGSCTVVWSNPDGMQETRYAERVWFDDVQAAPTRAESLGSSDTMTTAAQFSVFYRNDLGLPFYDAEQVAQLQFESGRIHSGLQTSGSDLSTPEAGAAFTILRSAAGQFEASEEIPDADEGTSWANFRFADGTLLKLEMQPVQLDGSQGAVWLPIGWRILDASGEIIDGTGRQYSPYDAQVYAIATDYYGYRDTDDLLWYLDMGWADGAYAEGILSELDRRWELDPAAVEDAVLQAGTQAQTLWLTHRGDIEPRFSEDEIEAAYQAVRDYAAANGFSVENLRYDMVTDWSQSQVILRNGVLQDNVQQDGLTLDDVITVVGDAQFGENAWRESADGWSFTLYRGADGRWVLEDGAYGY